ncbi:hypothetical protein [Spongiactinospora sp. TRM90649]|uniref:hypothetical protein n=1 Tax=Spongiactinospora sp. TRM90649 TaxID=3031114 RepID=UPI0023F9924A|nr:hypothetical protein [Spongiactinospora sp. TRM90649]MDF5753155.1 hypothetical protein [Spongiactinospora sp. TRM90649]
MARAKGDAVGEQETTEGAALLQPARTARTRHPGVPRPALSSPKLRTALAVLLLLIGSAGGFLLGRV